MPDVPLCVYCRRRTADPAWKPFCSERCKMADLGRWLSGDYRIPGFPDSAAADEPGPDASGRDREDS
ncbi:zinc-binding protein [compost metagenome]